MLALNRQRRRERRPKRDGRREADLLTRNVSHILVYLVDFFAKMWYNYKYRCANSRKDTNLAVQKVESLRGKSSMDDKSRKEALRLAMETIEKDHGKGSVMRLGDDVKRVFPSIPTGSIALDVALGIGGLPKGRIVEVYGPESSGKTTLTLHTIAAVQKQGGVAAFIDAEHALDPIYAEKLGVDTAELIVSQPDHGEQALEIANKLIRSGGIDLVVIDSVAALVPQVELSGAIGDATMGAQARLMSQALRKITGALNSTGTTAIFINQLREKIGVMFGSPETTTGGKALKFFASVRLDIRRKEPIKDGTEIIGNRTEIKVVKNKMAPPFKLVSVEVFYGEGISHESSLVDVAADQGVIKLAGSWYTYEGDQIGQGKPKARAYLKENPKIADEIEAKVREKLELPPKAKLQTKEEPVLQAPEAPRPKKKPTE